MAGGPVGAGLVQDAAVPHGAVGAEVALLTLAGEALDQGDVLFADPAVSARLTLTMVTKTPRLSYLANFGNLFTFVIISARS